MIREKHLIDNRGQNSGVIVEKMRELLFLTLKMLLKCRRLFQV